MIAKFSGNITLPLFETPYSGNTLIPESNFFFPNSSGHPTLFGRYLIRNVASQYSLTNSAYPPFDFINVGVLTPLIFSRFVSGAYSARGVGNASSQFPSLAETLVFPSGNGNNPTTNATQIITPELLTGDYKLNYLGDNIEFSTSFFWSGTAPAIWNSLADNKNRPLCAVIANDVGVYACSPFYGFLPNGNPILVGTDFSGGLYSGGIPVSCFPLAGKNYVGVGLTNGAVPGLYKAQLTAGIPNFPSSGFVVDIVQDLALVQTDNASYNAEFGAGNVAVLAGPGFFITSFSGFPAFYGPYSAVTGEAYPYLVFNADFTKYWVLNFAAQTAGISAMLAASTAENTGLTLSLGINAQGYVVMTSQYVNAGGFQIVASNQNFPLLLKYDIPSYNMPTIGHECLPFCARC